MFIKNKAHRVFIVNGNMTDFRTNVNLFERDLSDSYI